MVGTPDFDTVLDICEHKHRRIVLASLANQQQSASISNLTNEIIKHTHNTPPTEVDDETIKRIHAGLYQAQLPKLAEAGFVQYDPERNMVESTAQLRRDNTHLSTILGLDPDIPTT